MKPYANLSGKSHWAYFWEDKVKKNVKRVFKKSMRQINKRLSNYEGQETY